MNMDGLEVAICQSMCAVMIADCERWELSIPVGSPKDNSYLRKRYGLRC